MTTFGTPRLIADIGATWARMALEVAPGVFKQVERLRCAEFASFDEALSRYLKALDAPRIEHAAIAVATPVDGDQVRMTNSPWHFSIEASRQQLGLDTLVVVNDFSALAMALPLLGEGQTRQIGKGRGQDARVIALIGAGSGLGMSGLIPADGAWLSLGSEGGHSSFSPRDEREFEVWRFASERFGHVSFERLLSGPGLRLIHEALCLKHGERTENLSAPQISRRAIDASDARCVEALDVFCAVLGTAASNLAVTLGALGGIFIGGSIVPKLGSFFDRSQFRSRFEDKGRFGDYLAAIPSYVITDEQATWIGASTILQSQLSSLSAVPGGVFLSQLRQALDNLSPSERRVAEWVLAQPRSALNEPIAQIAAAAEVSQPTVIRFCRSLGCRGLSDFKLRLSSGLTATVPLQHSRVTVRDSVLELGAKVFGNTASAILQVRDQLDADQLELAIDMLSKATRVDLFAVGHYGGIAHDAQFKLLRLGVPCAAHVEGRLQVLVAKKMRPGELALVISSSGSPQELLDALDSAKQAGAMTLAITLGKSPLARRADAALVINHLEHVDTHLPMVSRILHLLMVDVLAVGLATHRELYLGRGIGESAKRPKTDPLRPRHGLSTAMSPMPAISHRLSLDSSTEDKA